MKVAFYLLAGLAYDPEPLGAEARMLSKLNVIYILFKAAGALPLLSFYFILQNC